LYNFLCPITQELHRKNGLSLGKSQRFKGHTAKLPHQAGHIVVSPCPDRQVNEEMEFTLKLVKALTQKRLIRKNLGL